MFQYVSLQGGDCSFRSNNMCVRLHQLFIRLNILFVEDVMSVTSFLKRLKVGKLPIFIIYTR